MTVTIEIDEPTPSVNALHGHHWSRKTKMRKRWAWLVRAAVCEARRAAEPGDPLLTAGLWPLKRAVVRVVRHGPRILDPDNAIAGCKWLIDQLVTEGLIVDDASKYLTLLPVEQHVGKPYRTTVEIAPCQS